MKKYSYLLVLSLVLFQIENTKAEWFNGPEIEPTTATIDRPTIQSLQKANNSLVAHYNDLMTQINSMKGKNNEFAGTPKFAEQDLTNLYRLVKQSFQPLIQRADSAEKQSLQSKLQKITDEYNAEMKDLKSRKSTSQHSKTSKPSSAK